MNIIVNMYANVNNDVKLLYDMLISKRRRESKATKHVDIQLFFIFMAEIVAEYFLKYCKIRCGQ